jgi:hypothetical protein
MKDCMRFLREDVLWTDSQHSSQDSVLGPDGGVVKDFEPSILFINKLNLKSAVVDAADADRFLLRRPSAGRRSTLLGLCGRTASLESSTSAASSSLANGSLPPYGSEDELCDEDKTTLCSPTGDCLLSIIFFYLPPFVGVVAPVPVCLRSAFRAAKNFNDGKL